jgi:hypothetical protein
LGVRGLGRRVGVVALLGCQGGRCRGAGQGRAGQGRAGQGSGGAGRGADQGVVVGVGGEEVLGVVVGVDDDLAWRGGGGWVVGVPDELGAGGRRSARLPALALAQRAPLPGRRAAQRAHACRQAQAGAVAMPRTQRVVHVGVHAALADQVLQEGRQQLEPVALLHLRAGRGSGSGTGGAGELGRVRAGAARACGCGRAGAAAAAAPGRPSRSSGLSPAGPLTSSTSLLTGSSERTDRMRLLMNSSGASASSSAPTTCAGGAGGSEGRVRRRAHARRGVAEAPGGSAGARPLRRR